MQDTQGYHIKLAEFYGPFDLLLFFIERDELDIYDIPIAKITDDFLQHFKAMEHLDIDLASEFILVASTLMQIKAKMLLPRKDLDEQGNEIDPREELVNQLLEYKRYKDILGELQRLEEEQGHKQERGNILEELGQLSIQAMADVELEHLNLYKLMKCYEQLMQRFKEQNTQVIHRVFRIPYTVEECKEQLIKKLEHTEKQDFSTVFDTCENRLEAIYYFLAILELLQEERLDISLGEGFNSFELSLVFVHA